MTRILIADDQAVVRKGLRAILETQPDWEVVAEAADGKEAIRKAIETAPDVVVVTYSPPVVNSVEVTQQICTQLPNAEVLIFTTHNDENLMGDLLKAGARGYVLKTEPTSHLIEAVQSLAYHRAYFAPAATEKLLEAFLAEPPVSRSPLTSRERGVVQLGAEGHTTQRIARILNVSPKTIETHRATVMRKLDMASSANLVRYAIRNHLAEA